MRRIKFMYGLIFCALIWAGTGFICLGQNGNLNKAISYFEDYEKFNDQKSFAAAKEKIDSASRNPATSGKYKTWFYRGKIYLARFDLDLKNEMNKSAETDINKKIISAYNSISMADVDEALTAFQKALELDEKKVYESESNAKIRVIATNYGDKAYSNLVNKNYADALIYFDKSYDMKLKMGMTDTAAASNMAVAARNLKEYQRAEKYYNRLVEIYTKPEKKEKSYYSMIQMFREAGDTASMRKYVNLAVAALPESYVLLIEQINLLLMDGKYEAAVTSLNRALGKDPQNHELHLVLGQTYNKMAFPKDAEGKDMARPENSAELAKKAEDEFNKTIQIKGDYVPGFYTMGVFYNNMGADILKQSDKLKDAQKLKAIEENADILFRKAIPFMEKAHDLDPGDGETTRILRQLYIRTGQGDSEKCKKLN